jgi:hypothetical protein
MKESIKLLTFQEVKVRLEKVQKTLEALQAQDKVLTDREKKQKVQLISLRESLENKLNILTEMDKGVIHTDDENKAKELAQKGVQVQLHKKGEPLDTKKIKEAEGLQFDQNQTKEIAKEVAKAIAMALKEEGIEIANGKILRLEPMAFDTYFQYKDGKEDEFSFHIDQDKNIILSDFTFTEKIGQVGLKGAGEPFVNKDVIKANLIKVWAKLDGNMQEAEGDQDDLMAQLEQALKSHDWYYMMSDDHRWYKRGSEQAQNIHNLITKLKEAGQGEEAEALYKSYHEKNRVQETATNEYKIGDKVSKKYASTDDDFHNEYEIVSIENGRATVKDLKTGKTTGMAISDLMVAEASIGSIQKKHGELVAKMKALAAQYKGGDQSVIPQLKAMTIEKKKLEAELDAKVAGTGADQELDANVTEAEKAKKDFDKDGDVESPEAEYKGVKTKAIKKAMVKKEAVKAKKDFDKDGDVESPEAEYKGVKDKAVKKAMLKEDWGSSDQGVMNRAIHKDLGEPEEMPMPFDNDFESAVEDAVDFYWNEWEEYQSDRDGLIDHAKRAYYRRYFPEKFAGFQKMFSEAAEQSYADLETVANNTANMPADRDAARNKMYDLKKKSRGTKLAEAPEGTYYIKVSIRDAKRALEIIHDNPAYRKAVEMDGSDAYYLTNPELAYDLQMDFGTQNIEVVDTNVDMDEAKHETELVQDPNSKEFTRKMKMTPKDMDTITKVQDMMAKEKSMKKEGEEEDYYAQNDTAVDITGKAYSIGDIIEFRGHKFECQIGQRGIVVLQHVDDELNPLPEFYEGGTPQFTAILKNAKIVSRGMGISEGGVNPEGDRMVLTFLKKLSKIWDIPMAHAVNFVNASIKRQGY